MREVVQVQRGERGFAGVEEEGEEAERVLYV